MSLPTFQDRLRDTLKSTGLTVVQLEGLLGWSPDSIAQILDGSRLATSDELKSISAVFGRRPQRFLQGPTNELPGALFFKSIDLAAVVPDLVSSQVVPPLGRFLTVVEDIFQLESKLGRSPTRLPTLNSRPRSGASQWMEAAALELRKHLCIPPDAPIPSVVEVCEQLGIVVLLVTPDELLPSVEGVSTLLPRPAVLVNAIEPPSSIPKPVHRWRMTLAHELAHLLLHCPTKGTCVTPVAAVAASKSAGRWGFFEDFWEVESEANALAACFLAPRDAVRALVAAKDVHPVSEAAIEAVGAHFGLGWEASVNRLQIACGLKGDERKWLLERRVRYSTATSEPSNDDRFGFSPPMLRQLVDECLAQQLLSKTTAWEVLGLATDKDAPVGWLSEVHSAAPVSGPARARSAAMRWLQAHGFPDHLAVSAEPTDSGWQVAVAQSARDSMSLVPAGYLLVLANGQFDDSKVTRSR